MFKPPYITKAELVNKLEELRLNTIRVQLALEYAEHAHKHQKRDFGKPYLEEHIYPITFHILKLHAADPNIEDIVILGILHDVVEDDQTVTIQKIEEEFGMKVASNLDYLTKKAADNLSTLPEQVKTEINKKMLERIANAPHEVQIIKFEDRLNNLQSFEKPSALKYQRYVQETKDLFIPLAERTVVIYKQLFVNELNRFDLGKILK